MSVLKTWDWPLIIFIFFLIVLMILDGVGHMLGVLVAKIDKNPEKMSDNLGRLESCQEPKEFNFFGMPLWNLKSVSGDLIKSASILPKNITLSIMSLSETL